MLDCKKQLFKESMQFEKNLENIRNILKNDQIAKFLILMEKFKTKEEFSVFNLWNIRKLNKE